MGGGLRLWSENGDECGMGGLTKFSPLGVSHHAPQGKTPAGYRTSTVFHLFVETYFLKLDHSQMNIKHVIKYKFFYVSSALIINLLSTEDSRKCT